MSAAQIGNLQVALGINTAQFSAGLAQAQGSLGSFGKGLKSLAAAAGVSLSLGALGIALKSNIDHMDELGKAAQKIGIPVAELSKLEYAAKLSDVSLEDLTTTLSKFSKNVAEIAGGGQNDAGRALSALGIAAVDAQGNLRPTTDILNDIADKLSVMKDGAGKTALMLAIFGKSGANLIPLMNGGGQAIAAAGRELQNFGGVITPEAAQQAQDFNDNLTRLQTAFNGLLQQALIPILPKLTELTQDLIDMTKTGSQVQQFIESVTAWLDEWGPSLDNTKREIQGITDELIYLGLIAKKPLEININGGQEAQGPAPPKQTQTAPIIPQPTKTQSSPVPKIPQDTIDSIYGAGTAFDAMWASMEQGMPDTAALTTAFQDLGDTITNSLGYAIEGLISGTMSVKDAFASMAQSISSELSQLAAQLMKSAILKVIQMMLGSAGGAGFSVGGMTFGGLYADGGTLGSGKWGVAGEAGPELVKGPASITPMDKMAGGSPQMNVTVINNSGASVNTRKNSRGDLEVMVEDMLADKLMRGGNKIDAAMTRGYGLRRSGRS